MKYPEYFSLLFLCVSSVLDLKNKTHKISFSYFFICLLLSIAMILICNRSIWKESLFGLLIGLFFLIISKITEEAIGYGDSFCYLIIGILNGWQTELKVVCLSILFGAIVAMVFVVKNRFQRCGKMPFIPVLTFSYLFVLCI
ncbi:MAG: prepilin peptidase [Lachnospiraceae bacterium]